MIEIGSRPWQPDRKGPWVSKTDVLQFLQCPYRVFLHHQNGTPYEEFLGPELRQQLFEPGIAWEETVLAQQKALEIDSLDQARQMEGSLILPPLIRNHDLGLVGRPDLLYIEKGMPVPVEIKRRHQLEPERDRLELAFYWLLLGLESERSVGGRRWGYMWLGTGERTRLWLRRDDLQRVKELVRSVREVVRQQPSLSYQQACVTCKLRQQHLPIIWAQKGVSMIWGVGPIRSSQLRELGVHTVSDLAAADSMALHQRWRRLAKYAPGLEELKRMQAHARALLTGEVQRVGDALPPPKEALLLDLEYDSQRPQSVFVAGLLLVQEGGEAGLHQGFAETEAEEEKVLASLARWLERYPNYPVVTWNGSAADLPTLASACSRWGLTRIMKNLQERHQDLYLQTLRSIRLPVLSYGLKEVAAWLGEGRPQDDVSAWEIPDLWRQYLRKKDPDLKRRILEHNAADLRSLLTVWHSLAGQCQQQLIPPPQSST